MPERFRFKVQAQYQPFRLERNVISVGGVEAYMEQAFPTEARMENIAVHMTFPEQYI